MGKRGRLGTVRRKPRSEQPQARDAPPKNVTSYEDVADSEDEFFVNKDKVLLDGLGAQRPDDDLLDFSDEEVLKDSMDDTDDEGSEEDDGDDAYARTESPERSTNGKEGEEDEALETWGRSRRDYYNQDEIETEGDALEEEEEARRLQQKRLRGKSEADFGLDDDWLDAKAQSAGERLADGHGDGVATTEVLPEVEITDSMGLDERLQLLNARYPEFGPLSEEFIRLQPLHASLSETRLRQAKAAQADDSRSSLAPSQQRSPSLNVANLKYQALTAYLGALSMYFALLTTPSNTNGKTTVAISPSDLREHAIMDSLVTCRQIWEEVKDIPLPDTEKPARTHGVGANKATDTPEKPKKAAPRAVNDRAQRRKESRMQTRQAALAVAHAEAEKQLDEEIRRTEEELAKITSLARSKPVSSASRDAHSANDSADDDSDHREGTSLGPLEAAEKARRKKTLRFYTSQIAQKANRRNNAGKDVGGDADIPYRERLKDRQARLNAQAERRRDRSPRDKLTALSDTHSDQESHGSREADRADNESEDDYYDMVAAAAKKRKIAKKSLNSTSGTGEVGRKGGLRNDEEEALGPDNKRAIGYMIEKNKGLAPKRKKEVRNPRVKKRKKFAEKQKKLGSVRQVYRGGEERGGYSGEATGIKTRLVKSIKL